MTEKEQLEYDYYWNNTQIMILKKKNEAIREQLKNLKKKEINNE